VLKKINQVIAKSTLFDPLLVQVQCDRCKPLIVKAPWWYLYTYFTSFFSLSTLPSLLGFLSPFAFHDSHAANVSESFITHLDSFPETEIYSHVSDENKKSWFTIKQTGADHIIRISTIA